MLLPSAAVFFFRMMKSNILLRDATKSYILLRDATKSNILLRDATKSYILLRDATASCILLSNATLFQQLVESIRRQIQAIIEVKGHQTK